MRGSHSSRGLILALAVTCVAPSPSAAFLSGVVGAGQLDTWRCRVVQATGVSALRMGTSDRRKALQTLFTAGVTGIGAMQTCAPGKVPTTLEAGCHLHTQHVLAPREVLLIADAL
jgi:hypothetical protein